MNGICFVFLPFFFLHSDWLWNDFRHRHFADLWFRVDWSEIFSTKKSQTKILSFLLRWMIDEAKNRRFYFLFQMIFIYGFFLLLWSSSINAGDEFEDYRCKCVCPSLTVINNSSFSDNNRRIYVNVVQANNCSCKNVVFLSINASDAFKDQFCLRFSSLSLIDCSPWII